MSAGENEAYYAALRFYQGALTEAQALDGAEPQGNRLATVGYGCENGATHRFLRAGALPRPCHPCKPDREGV